MIEGMRGRLVDREAEILARADGRSVLHLGCADVPLHLMRAATGTLLHDKLRKRARTIVGVDLDVEGVRFLRDDLGFREVIQGDATALHVPGFTEPFELVIAGEILEHLSNPGACLASCRSVLKTGGLIIVSVPNAHAIKGFVRSALGRELVHPDHVAYYSPRTIVRLLQTHGFDVLELDFCATSPMGTFKRSLDRILMGPLRRMLPQVSDGLVVIARARP